MNETKIGDNTYLQLDKNGNLDIVDNPEIYQDMEEVLWDLEGVADDDIDALVEKVRPLANRLAKHIDIRGQLATAGWRLREEIEYIIQNKLYLPAPPIRPEIEQMLDADAELQGIIENPTWQNNADSMQLIVAIARVRSLLWHPPEGEVAGHDDPEWNQIAKIGRAHV